MIHRGVFSLVIDGKTTEASLVVFTVIETGKIVNAHPKYNVVAAY